jgi:hypothetical protein
MIRLVAPRYRRLRPPAWFSRSLAVLDAKTALFAERGEDLIDGSLR